MPVYCGSVSDAKGLGFEGAVRVQWQRRSPDAGFLLLFSWCTGSFIFSIGSRRVGGASMAYRDAIPFTLR